MTERDHDPCRPREVGRRDALRKLSIFVGVAGVPTLLWRARARAAPPMSRDERRLANRLELWGNFSRKSRQNLLARYASVRTSSLLRDDLVGGGSLVFVPPATLVLRDDSPTGSTTRIEPGSIAITPNDPSLPTRPIPPRDEAPALAWLADHLVACFAADADALVADARTEVPKRGSRLTLLPPRDSIARAAIRSLALTLDPVGGAIVRLEIAEADGGTFVLRISDHRQNVEEAALSRILAPL